MRLLTLRSVSSRMKAQLTETCGLQQNGQTCSNSKSARSVCGIAMRGGVIYCALQVLIFKIGTGHIEIGIVICKRFLLHGKFFFICWHRILLHLHSRFARAMLPLPIIPVPVPSTGIIGRLFAILKMRF